MKDREEKWVRATNKERWRECGVEVLKQYTTPKGWKRVTTTRRTEVCEVQLECGHWLRKDLGQWRKDKSLRCCRKCNDEAPYNA